MTILCITQDGHFVVMEAASIVKSIGRAAGSINDTRRPFLRSTGFIIICHSLIFEYIPRLTV